MIGYVMLGTNDIARARAFWDPLTTSLGARVVDAFTSEKRVWYASAPNAPLLAITQPYDGAPASAGNGTMIAIPVLSTAQVDATHARALELGGVDDGAPGPRGDPNFYGAYFRDPDGNKICVFNHRGA